MMIQIYNTNRFAESSTPFVAVMTLLVLSVGGCAPQAEVIPDEIVDVAAQEAADTEAIHSLFEQYDATISGGDMTAFLALLAEDVLWMVPDQTSLVGHAGVKERVQPWFEELRMGHHTTLDEIVLAGQWAYVRGTYTFQATPKAGGEAAGEQGKLLYILRRSPDASWRIARGVWNRNEAPSS